MYVTRHTLVHASPPVPLGIRLAFDRFMPAPHTAMPHAASSRWSPRVDIREDEQRFVILADVPGIDPALIEVSMDNGVLSIKGVREAGNSNATGVAQRSGFNRVEREHGEFVRRFSLPDSADAEGITASGKFGLLEISIPKKPLPAPRRITINGGN